MKFFIHNKLAVLVILASVVLLLLSACSGVIGSDYNVRISIPQLASVDGRFISANASSGYFVVLKGDKIYSFNEFSGQERLFGINLPLDTYIFGVVLLDSEERNVGLAIKERKIEEGVNEFTFDIGPGIHNFSIDGHKIEELFNNPEGYIVSFADNTIKVYHDELTDPDVPISITVGYNPETTQILETLSNKDDPIKDQIVEFSDEGVAYNISLTQDEDKYWRYSLDLVPPPEE